MVADKFIQLLYKLAGGRIVVVCLQGGVGCLSGVGWTRMLSYWYDISV